MRYPEASQPAASRPAVQRPAAPLRRVTDEHGRTWSVRDIAVTSHRVRGRLIGRIYSCDEPGPIPELSRPWRPLAPPGTAGDGGS